MKKLIQASVSMLIIMCLLLNAFVAYADGSVTIPERKVKTTKTTTTKTTQTSGSLTKFNSIMMKSASSQVRQPTDFLLNDGNRAIIAALLTLEFQCQKPNVKIDFTNPIYVGKKDSSVFVVFSIGTKYVSVFYSFPPLTTAYGYIDAMTDSAIRNSLSIVSDTYYKVDMRKYNSVLQKLIKQLQNQ